VARRHGAIAAILYRSNAQSRVFEEAFIAARIPYKCTAACRFFERAEIKDALAYLALDLQPQGRCLVRARRNLPPRGVGAKSLDVVRESAKGAGSSLWKPAGACVGDALGRNLRRPCTLTALIERWRARLRAAAAEQVDQVLQGSGLIEYYKRERRIAAEGSGSRNLEELVSAARASRPRERAGSCPPLEAFLAHAVLESGEGQRERVGRTGQMMIGERSVDAERGRPHAANRPIPGPSRLIAHHRTQSSHASALALSDSSTACARKASTVAAPRPLPST